MPVRSTAVAAAVAALSLSLAFTTSVAARGPLDPPAGPIASTPGPEPRTVINAVNTPGDADSLFKITQPGSYYLAGNITGVSGKKGIEIASRGVTVDLNGFRLRGVAGSLDGVFADGAIAFSDVTVKNGIVVEWGGNGVNVSDGAQVTGARVNGVQSNNNTGAGIAVGPRAQVSDCVALSNVSAGFSAGSGAVFIGCGSTGNSTGYLSNTGGTFDSCIAVGNFGDGFNVSNAGNFSHCTSNSNSGNGFFAANGGVLTGCMATQNHVHGFNLSSACTVASCTAYFNDQHGIIVGTSCTVINSTANSNGSAIGDGAGIRCQGGDNRVEGNNSSANDRGIDCQVAGNIIFRNTCAANTINWSLAANNVFGPILDRTAPGSGAVSGSSAPDSSGTTNPNANFSF
jgi:hypothetical protein